MQSGGNLAEMIKQLEADRRRHADAIEQIDQVLTQVGRVVGFTAEERSAHNAATLNVSAPAPEVRRRGKFELTGERSVLQFIARHQNPTTAEINHHWRSEGRRGVANVILLKLLKQGLIHRQMDATIRGSRYLIASLGDEASQVGAAGGVDALSPLSRRMGASFSPTDHLPGATNRLS
jgi:hypothetical protein